MAKKKTTPKEMLIVQSKAKDLLREMECNVSSEAMNGLNAFVYWLIEQAAKRAKENGRKTVRDHDFLIQ